MTLHPGQRRNHGGQKNIIHGALAPGPSITMHMTKPGNRHMVRTTAAKEARLSAIYLVKGRMCIVLDLA